VGTCPFLSNVVVEFDEDIATTSEFARRISETRDKLNHFSGAENN
jgi:hypothetical protein